ncbi:unnamed protein product [Sphagnum balticum]
MYVEVVLHALRRCRKASCVYERSTTSSLSLVASAVVQSSSAQDFVQSQSTEKTFVAIMDQKMSENSQCTNPLNSKLGTGLISSRGDHSTGGLQVYDQIHSSMLRAPLLTASRGRPFDKLLCSTMAEADHIPATTPAVITSYLNILKRAGAEFMAVFLVVFMAGGTTIVNTQINGDLTLMGLAIAGGIPVMLMIYAIGGISGAHMNPAVSLAFASKGVFPFAMVPVYAFAQVLGSTTAAALLRGLFNDPQALITFPYMGSGKAFIVEAISGFNLAYVATAVTTGFYTSGELAGIAVAATVIINILFAGPVSGASMNPARSLGAAIVANSYHGIWIYMLAPTIGALAGAWIHKLVQIQ